jgi:hypothetical protein
MIIQGAMTVLAADGRMWRLLDIVILVLMARYAGFGCPVFDGIFFPIGFVGRAVPTVHIAPLADTEVFRYEYHS